MTIAEARQNATALRADYGVIAQPIKGHGKNDCAIAWHDKLFHSQDEVDTLRHNLDVAATIELRRGNRV